MTKGFLPDASKRHVFLLQLLWRRETNVRSFSVARALSLSSVLFFHVRLEFGSRIPDREEEIGARKQKNGLTC